MLPAIRPRRPRRRLGKGNTGYILVVLGSGGHTTEMLMLLKDLHTTFYSLRRYVISEGDNHSINKMREFEARLETYASVHDIDYGRYDYKIVPRARRIHQSLITTPRTALITFTACLGVFSQSPKRNQADLIYPDLVITNGPATGFILICVAFVLRYLALTGTGDTLRCIYVESWARLHSLSLTGKLLRLGGLCDRFLVQWPGLEVHNSRRKQLGEYHGPLVI